LPRGIDDVGPKSFSEIVPLLPSLGGESTPSITNSPRFPLEAVPTVRRRLADLLAKERAVALVCSAACGADLVALEEAERLGLRRRIVLPFPPERFRKTSVTDRPGAGVRCSTALLRPLKLL
jgi:hypothetical protein